MEVVEALGGTEAVVVEAGAEAEAAEADVEVEGVREVPDGAEEAAGLTAEELFHFFCTPPKPRCCCFCCCCCWLGELEGGPALCF